MHHRSHDQGVGGSTSIGEGVCIHWGGGLHPGGGSLHPGGGGSASRGDGVCIQVVVCIQGGVGSASMGVGQTPRPPELGKRVVRYWNALLLFEVFFFAENSHVWVVKT